MRIQIQCPECRATERLAGERTDGRIFITCEACGHRWESEGPAEQSAV